MGASMPRHERERYNRAFLYAVVERNVAFPLADDFADWYTRAGWTTHREDIAGAWDEWIPRGLPRAPDED